MEKEEAKDVSKGGARDDDGEEEEDDLAFRDFLDQLREAGSSATEDEARERWGSLREDIRGRFLARVRWRSTEPTVTKRGKKRRAEEDETSAVKTAKKKRMKNPPPPPSSLCKRPYVAFSVLEGRRMEAEAAATGTPRPSLAKKARELSRRWAEMDQEEKDKYRGGEVKEEVEEDNLL